MKDRVTSKHDGKEEFGQIENAKKLPSGKLCSFQYQES